MEFLNGFCGQGIGFTVDGFRIVYVIIACFMWAMTALFSPQYFKHYTNRKRYYAFFWLTFGALVGVFLSKDLFTTFIFFEIMSFTSYVWVAQDERPESLRAAITYLAVAVIGGLVMLMGLFMLQNGGYNKYLTCGLICFGFAAKAGVYPLHIWLPKAHPVAPAPASALLSGILTKAGIYGVLVLSCNVFLHDVPWGRAILVLGTLTMVTGAVIAVFSINLKRTLACSSVSQIGFILVGIGMQCLLGEENALAVWGTELHMVNHSLIKLVLFMTAGAIYMNIHRLDLNDIRGFGRGKPLLTGIFLCGYLGIAGVPGFNGYISKTLLHESIVEYTEVLEAAGKSILAIKSVEWLFLFSGGLTVAYMTKLFVAVFVEKNADPALQAKYDALNGKYMNLKSSLALGVSAVILPVIGAFPSVFMKRMAELGQGFMNGSSPEHAIKWFSGENLKGAAISIAIGAIVYFCFIRPFLMKKTDGVESYVNRWPDKVDIENAIYRPLCALLAKIAVAVSSAAAYTGDRIIPKLSEFAALLISGIAASLPDWIVGGARKTVLRPIPIPEYDPAEHEHAELAADIELPERTDRVLSSFSYGLILFGVGLLITIVFLMLIARN